MEFSIATLLSHLSEDKLIAGKILEKKLGCEDEKSIQTLQIVLDTLERIGILEKERGKYRRARQEGFVEAKLRCSSKGFCFAIQDDEDAEDIYVRENQLNNAWNGDRVLVTIIKEGSRRRSPEGAVKLILERANPSVLAQVKQEGSEYRAVPLDDRLLFELNLVENGQDLASAVNHLAHISVLRYPLGIHPPIGEVSRILGSDAETAADTDIVCCKHDLPQTFTAEVLEAAAALPEFPPESLLKERQDFRSALTFTLVSEASPWVETAFSLEKIRSDKWELGIHIADVAHYVEPDSPLDRVARKRGTAVYLGEKVLPLLPEAVAQRCSLIPGADRLALSLLLDFDQEGNVVKFAIRPSAIRVDCQLTYQQAQAFLSSPGTTPREMAGVIEKLQTMLFSLSPPLKARRFRRGSFDIQSTTQIPYPDEDRIGAILVSSQLPARALLQELAVLAGKAVADHLFALGVPGIYCAQKEPDWEELEDLLKLANNLQLDVALATDEDVTPTDFYNLTQAFVKSPEAPILNYLLQGTLRSVKYSSHPAPHFGLAYSDGYTHCLAPAQRYADLVVQRVLKTVLAEGRDRRIKHAKTGVDLGSSSCHGKINWKVLPSEIQETWEEDFHRLVSHLNDRKKLVEDAEKDLEGLKKAEKMKERTGQVFQGLIIGVQSYGFFVEIEELLVEGLVHVSSLKDDWYEYRARHSCLVGRKNRVAYRLGDKVEVQVKSVDYYRQQIDLATVGGGSAASSEDWDE
jgi:ribonuclease R